MENNRPLGRNSLFFVIVPNRSLRYGGAMQTTTRPSDHTAATRLISMLAFDDADILDITGPLDVFSLANTLLQEAGRPTPAYKIELVGIAADQVIRTASGIRLLTDLACSSRTQTDTLLVPGGPDPDTIAGELIDWIRRTSPLARRVGSICSGAFLLARAGLLDGRRATTHWRMAAELQQRFPRIEVTADAIYVRDGSLYTSAGITAGIDLALALVEEDFGRVLALNTARMLVLYFKRPGGQSQFSTGLLSQYREGGVLSGTVQWIREHFRQQLTNELLAEQAAMSLRNFSRLFKRETGCTPARFIEKIRLEAAVALLEGSCQALETIARECGFQSGEHFRQAFVRSFGITPGEYRDRFCSQTGTL